MQNGLLFQKMQRKGAAFGIGGFGPPFLVVRPGSRKSVGHGAWGRLQSEPATMHGRPVHHPHHNEKPEHVSRERVLRQRLAGLIPEAMGRQGLPGGEIHRTSHRRD